MKDLAELCLEILINSIEADASKIDFELSLDTQNKVVIHDNGKGIDPDILIDITNPYHTSRLTRQLGFGLAFFKQAIEQANGHIEISSTLKVGTRVEGIWDSGHIDAIPLGNIGESVALVIQRMPELEFTFSLRIQDELKEFKSLEVKEAIHPLSLAEVEIIAWIETYINSLFVTTKENV